MSRSCGLFHIQLLSNALKSHLTQSLCAVLQTSSKLYQKLHSQKQALMRHITYSISQVMFSSTNLRSSPCNIEQLVLVKSTYLDGTKCAGGMSACNDNFLVSHIRLDAFVVQMLPATYSTSWQDYKPVHYPLYSCPYATPIRHTLETATVLL